MPALPNTETTRTAPQRISPHQILEGALYIFSNGCKVITIQSHPSRPLLPHHGFTIMTTVSLLLLDQLTTAWQSHQSLLPHLRFVTDGSHSGPALHSPSCLNNASPLLLLGRAASGPLPNGPASFGLPCLHHFSTGPHIIGPINDTLPSPPVRLVQPSPSLEDQCPPASPPPRSKCITNTPPMAHHSAHLLQDSPPRRPTPQSPPPRKNTATPTLPSPHHSQAIGPYSASPTGLSLLPSRSDCPSLHPTCHGGSSCLWSCCHE